MYLHYVLNDFYIFVNMFLQKNVDANAILFVDKKKAAKLSAESSTQWLEQLKDHSSNVIIRKTHAKINFPQEKSVSAKGIGESDTA